VPKQVSALVRCDRLKGRNGRLPSDKREEVNHLSRSKVDSVHPRRNCECALTSQYLGARQGPD